MILSGDVDSPSSVELIPLVLEFLLLFILLYSCILIFSFSRITYLVSSPIYFLSSVTFVFFHFQTIKLITIITILRNMFTYSSTCCTSSYSRDVIFFFFFLYDRRRFFFIGCRFCVLNTHDTVSHNLTVR